MLDVKDITEWRCETMQQQEHRQTTTQHNTAVMLVIGGLLFLGGILISLLGEAVQAVFIQDIGGMISVIGALIAIVAIVMVFLLRRQRRIG